MRLLPVRRALGALVICLALVGARAGAQPVQYSLDKRIDASTDMFGPSAVRSVYAPALNETFVARMSGLNGATGATGATITVSRFYENSLLYWQTAAPARVERPASIDYIIPCPDHGVIVAARYTGDGPELDYYVIHKITQQGVYAWSYRVSEHLDDLIVDKDGSVFLAASINSRGQSACYVDRLAAAGWRISRQYLNNDPESWALIAGLTPDGFGGVYVTGYFNGTVYSNDIGQHAQGIVLADFKGDIPLGPVQFIDVIGGNGIAIQRAKRDPAGNVYVIGSTANGYDLFKLSPSGQVLWHTPITSGFDLSFLKMELDAGGNVVLLARPFQFTTAYRYLWRFSPNGQKLWSKTFPSGTYERIIDDFTTDPSGNVMALFTTNSATSAHGIQMVKYLPNGDLGWPNLPQGGVTIDTADDEYAGSINRGFRGRMFVSGSFHSAKPANGYLVAKYGPFNDAFLERPTGPTSMVAGQSYTVTIYASNDGFSDWTAAGGYYLRAINPTDNANWGRSRVDLAPLETISSSKTFTFTVIAPTTAGNYNFQWRMSQGTHPFGDATPNKVIPVFVRQHAARYLSQVVPASVKAGSTFTVTVTMENVGTNVWTQAGGYSLAGLPVYSSAWGGIKIPLATGDSISRGGSKTFTFTCVAPTTPGNYAMQWTMRRDASAFTGLFGDATIKKTIAVIP